MNADFDALASMLAAKKLYPNATLVFPGSQEGSLRDFFLQSTLYIFDFEKIKQVDLEKVERLILVDTRQAGRIGDFKDIVGKNGVDIHIYDHHPPSPDDITGSVEVIREVGANTTIMVSLLRERDICLTPEEATVMATGIYEDTGSFNFSSTREEDFSAAAFLLSKGADLNIVSDLITRELTVEQVSLLHDLIESAKSYDINGVAVVITKVSSNRYVGDFALLAHKFIDMENINVLFALARMEDRVYMVARSRISEVNVGEIAMTFGGGGHPTAASAAIKNETLLQVEKNLILVLRSKVNPTTNAGSLMSSPAITVEVDKTIQDALDLIIKYNINGAPVVSHDQLKGQITRQVLEKAAFHGLRDLPVKELMSPDTVSVHPNASLYEIQQLFFVDKQRLLPVCENDRLVGIITRTDLLNALIGQPTVSEYLYDSSKGHDFVRTKKIKSLMAERLPEDIFKLLQDIGEAAEELSYNAYAVGGFVRDLLLRRDNFDIDVVIEGDGIHFARVFAKKHNLRMRHFIKFRTAVLIFPDGYKVDVATARLEYYESPAALPVVEISSIKLDLHRRDFIMNTLAVKLNSKHFGTLIDFFGAQKDIKEKVIRVLHNLSFVEDPTRVFRAIRFEQRFGLKIDKLTANLIKNAIKIKCFDHLSGIRIFSELRLILLEDNPASILAEMNHYKLLPVIWPDLRWSPSKEKLINRIKEVISWYELSYIEESFQHWLVYFLGLTSDLKWESLEALCERLMVPTRKKTAIITDRAAADRILKKYYLRKNLMKSEIYNDLNLLSNEALLYMMARTGKDMTRRSISLYLNQLRYINLHLTGRGLKDMGYKPGPVFKQILSTLFQSKLDDIVKTPEDEIDYVKAHWPLPLIDRTDPTSSRNPPE
ncbi:MAG: CBS domain-containing protein [Deltaproteobacteria bacterium]|nr:CBS domain-containing protein [Deltaproteobacteria bacterium]